MPLLISSDRPRESGRRKSSASSSAPRLTGVPKPSSPEAEFARISPAASSRTARPWIAAGQPPSHEYVESAVMADASLRNDAMIDSPLRGLKAVKIAPVSYSHRSFAQRAATKLRPSMPSGEWTT
jgi:hypothetical protein